MAWYLWIFIAILCIIIESFSTQFILVWFSISSLAASIASYLKFNINIQLLIFIILGLILLIIFRTKLAKKIQKSFVPTNSDSLIGQTAYISKINNHNLRVTIHGIDWKANCDDSNLEINQSVKIVDIQGVTLIVKKINQ